MDTSHLPATLATYRGRVLRTDDIRGAGVTRQALAALSARGTIMRVRDGWYWVPPAGKVWNTGLYRARVEATWRAAHARGQQLVLAGASAAIWMGLPWVGELPQQVIVAPERAGGTNNHSTLRRIGAVVHSDLAVCRGVTLTNAARTVADVARLHPGRTALAVGDAAAHQGLVTPAAVAQRVETLGPLRGIDRARWCAANINGLAESVGESVSRYEAIRGGIAPSQLQCEFVLPNGMRVRVDMHWDARTPRCGEYDGRCKYGRENPSGQPPADVVYQEKLREDGLREIGQAVSRWCWADVWHPGPWISRLRAQLLS